MKFTTLGELYGYLRGLVDAGYTLEEIYVDDSNEFEIEILHNCKLTDCSTVKNFILRETE